jgi:hypothetical protein
VVVIAQHLPPQSLDHDGAQRLDRPHARSTLALSHSTARANMLCSRPRQLRIVAAPAPACWSSRMNSLSASGVIWRSSIAPSRLSMCAFHRQRYFLRVLLSR